MRPVFSPDVAPCRFCNAIKLFSSLHHSSVEQRLRPSIKRQKAQIRNQKSICSNCRSCCKSKRRLPVGLRQMGGVLAVAQDPRDICCPAPPPAGKACRKLSGLRAERTTWCRKERDWLVSCSLRKWVVSSTLLPVLGIFRCGQ